ncbi:hypothetical protein BJ741DRAFT_651831 [Chytriomyces cf. hyalinus JEL632]|nr:hypothetical protein BJ741DRAFT_651831 [Chytriomyces cf. hyalinus JEL632]
MFRGFSVGIYCTNKEFGTCARNTKEGHGNKIGGKGNYRPRSECIQGIRKKELALIKRLHRSARNTMERLMSDAIETTDASYQDHPVVFNLRSHKRGLLVHKRGLLEGRHQRQRYGKTSDATGFSGNLINNKCCERGNFEHKNRVGCDEVLVGINESNEWSPRQWKDSRRQTSGAFLRQDKMNPRRSGRNGGMSNEEDHNRQ